MRAFESRHPAKSALEARSIDLRIEQYHELRAYWRDLRADGVFDSKPRELSLGVIADATDEFPSFQFELEAEVPYGLTAVLSGLTYFSVCLVRQRQRCLRMLP